MSACLKNKFLQSFADRELSAAALASASAHLAACAICRGQLANIQAANLHAQSLLDSLLPEDVPHLAPAAAIEFASKSPANHTQSTVAFVAGIAACALLAFVILRDGAQPKNLSSPLPISSIAANRFAAIASPSVGTAAISPAHPPSPHAHRAAHRSAARSIDSGPLDFIALDDGGPIESGMIMRMDLNASPKNSRAAHGAQKIPVDVLVDEQGEVRAIRFLNGGAK